MRSQKHTCGALFRKGHSTQNPTIFSQNSGCCSPIENWRTAFRFSFLGAMYLIQCVMSSTLAMTLPAGPTFSTIYTKEQAVRCKRCSIVAFWTNNISAHSFRINNTKENFGQYKVRLKIVYKMKQCVLGTHPFATRTHDLFASVELNLANWRVHNRRSRKALHISFVLYEHFAVRRNAKHSAHLD